MAMQTQKIRQTVNGLWVINGDTHLTKWVEETGRLDHDRTIDKLLEFIPQGGTAIDVGAAIGDHTIAYARKAGPNGRVFAFEPNPVAFRCLALNSFEFPQITPLNIGLWSHAAELGYSTDGQNWGASRVNTDGKESIRVCDLDGIAGCMKRLDFMKIDAEGSEPAILYGARRAIHEFRPVMFIELNKGMLNARGTSPIELVKLIEDMGYAVQDFDPLFADDRSFSRDQADIICRPL